MKTFSLTIAIWHDTFWRQNLRRSWKSRRFWLAKPCTPHVYGRALSLQFGALTIRITTVGAENTRRPGAALPQPVGAAPRDRPPRRPPNG